MTNFQLIAKNGTYYYPANKHYGGQGAVVCDRCNKAGLKACVGYNTSDLCLKCVDIIVSGGLAPPAPAEPPRFPDFPVHTLMAQDQFRQWQEQQRRVLPEAHPQPFGPDTGTPITLTNMRQSQFGINPDSPEIHTYMMQDQFRSPQPPRPPQGPMTRMMANWTKKN